MHDQEHDDWYGYNVDEEECIVEETLLEELKDEIKHENPLPCFELFQSMSPNPTT